MEQSSAGEAGGKLGRGALQRWLGQGGSRPAAGVGGPWSTCAGLPPRPCAACEPLAYLHSGIQCRDSTAGGVVCALVEGLSSAQDTASHWAPWLLLRAAAPAPGRQGGRLQPRASGARRACCVQGLMRRPTTIPSASAASRRRRLQGETQQPQVRHAPGAQRAQPCCVCCAMSHESCWLHGR